MQNYAAPYAVAGADVEDRSAFLLKTYIHLFGAILLFVGIQYVFFLTGVAEPMADAMLGTNWLFVLGGFMVVGWLASRAAHRAQSKAAQYAALIGSVFAWAVIFVPMLFMALYFTGDAQIINKAAWVTLLGFAGLTGVVFWTRKDFSFLGGMLKWFAVMAIVLIVAAVLFGLTLGTWFSVAMIAFAGAAILYDTSNVLHHYPDDRYVAASLELFASVALLFWYVLRLFMSRD